MFHSRIVPVLILLLAGVVHAQQDIANPGAGETGQLSYIGESSRLGIGYDSEFDLYGEFLQIFAERPDSAWLGTAWLAEDAGGLQLDYHWFRGDLENGDGTVHKLFLAFDQNTEQDQKLTLGWGLERDNYFGNVYLSGRITGRRLIDNTTDTVTDTLTGVDDSGRPFTQNQTTTTITDIYESAWDYGVGLRAGHFYEEPLIRVQGGLDYEWAEDDGHQFTVSLMGEKFFYNSPHSLALRVAYLDRDDPVRGSDDDARVRLLYRYDFGGPGYRPAQVPVPTPAVRNEISLQNDTFFAFDSARLRPEARQSLMDLASQLRQTERLSPIDIVGHTCNIGTDAYNQQLSERRANSVRDFLVAQGIPADQIRTEGRGEKDPRYSNATEASRRRNRRVDISVVTPGALSVPPAMRSEPVWIQRALRNPADHKRAVDVYQTQESRTTVETDEPQLVNRPPEAGDDSAATDSDTPVTIDVLANDSDADGDPLTIVAVGPATGGDVVNNGDSLTYTPDSGFTGIDSFTYTIDDGQGGQDSATVTVMVEMPAATNRPPEANDDRATTNPGIPVVIDVLANDDDPDGDPLSVVDVGSPDHGSAVIEGDQVRYTPDPGFRGTDRFDYTIDDSRGGRDSATVTVTVPRY